MPVNNDTLNKNLFDTLRAKGYDPIALDSKGSPNNELEKADVFRFEYKDYDNKGNVWATIEGNDLVIYIDDKFTKTSDFEPLTTYLKSWAQRRLLGFEITNKDHLVSDMQKRTNMKKKEQLGEAYHPMGKKASYNDSVPAVKIILQHTRQIEEGEQRFRNIAKIFVENTNGERFLLPTNRPGLARVYARHIAEGGTPYDDKGRHISTLVEEYSKMAGFVRATRNGQFNESALKLVNEGLRHYNELRMTLQGMASHRGYNKYFESYTPVLNEVTEDNTSLNELFVQETLDPRIENVLPILKRLNKNINEMNEVKELEEWAESVTEVEDETTKTLAEPAKEMLDELSGDLLDRASKKAADKAAQWDVRKHQVQHFLDPGDKDTELVKKFGQAKQHYEKMSDKMAGHNQKMRSKLSKAKWSSELPNKIKNLDEAPGAETLAHNDDTEKKNLKAFGLAEGTMAHGIFSDDPKEKLHAIRKLNNLLSNETSLTPAAAKEFLYELVFDDELFDIIGSAEDNDPEINLLSHTPFRKKLKSLLNAAGRRMTEGPADEPVEPDDDADDKRFDDIDEEIVNELSPKAKKAYAAAAKQDKEFNTKGMNQALHRAATDQAPGRAEWEDEAEFFKSVNAKRDRGLKRAGADVDEGLDANQKRVGQLGPTEPVGKNEKNLRGKLVGASESVEKDELNRIKEMIGYK